jgi:uncharacterized membrane protein YjjP (DUF1212 family)
MARKREPRHYHLTLNSELSMSGSVNKTVKRGDVSTGYFVATYVFLVAVFSTIIALINVGTWQKVLLIFLIVVLLSRLVFFGSWVRNKIIDIVNKIQNFEEKH